MKKRAQKLLSLGVSIVISLGVFTSCSINAENTIPQTTPEITTTAAVQPADKQTLITEPSPSDLYPLTITDMLGREVVIEEEPERLVSGYYITTSLLIALDVSDRLVGIEAKAERFPVNKLAAPDILNLPNVGSAKEFNLEGCAALEPDLVILPIKLKDAISSLEELGITVIGVDPEDKERLFETIKTVSKAVGAAERGEKLCQDIDSKYAMLEETLRDVECPKVYFAGNSAYLKTAGKGMYQNSLITAAGAENVAAEITDNYWVDISYEQLIAWNPEVIIISAGADYDVSDLTSDSALSYLDAIKNNRVYQMPSDVEQWDAPIPSSVLGSLWIASVLHDDVYNADDFADDFSGFYKEFYGIDVYNIFN